MRSHKGWKQSYIAKGIPDPLWCQTKRGFFYWFWCPIFGHKTITKMDGTVLCPRCR